MHQVRKQNFKIYLGARGQLLPDKFIILFFNLFVEGGGCGQSTFLCFCFLNGINLERFVTVESAEKFNLV